VPFEPGDNDDACATVGRSPLRFVCRGRSPQGPYPADRWSAALPVTMGSDGAAISSDGERLWYCPLMSRCWYSVSTQALLDRSPSDGKVAATVVDEGDKGGGADGLESDNQGRLYATNYKRLSVADAGHRPAGCTSGDPCGTSVAEVEHTNLSTAVQT
jgi:hypothetical protein